MTTFGRLLVAAAAGVVVAAAVVVVAILAQVSACCRPFVRVWPLLACRPIFRAVPGLGLCSPGKGPVNPSSSTLPGGGPDNPHKEFHRASGVPLTPGRLFGVPVRLAACRGVASAVASSASDKRQQRRRRLGHRVVCAQRGPPCS